MVSLPRHSTPSQSNTSVSTPASAWGAEDASSTRTGVVVVAVAVAVLPAAVATWRNGAGAGAVGCTSGRGGRGTQEGRAWEPLQLLELVVLYGCVEVLGLRRGSRSLRQTRGPCRPLLLGNVGTHPAGCRHWLTRICKQPKAVRHMHFLAALNKQHDGTPHARAAAAGWLGPHPPHSTSANAPVTVATVAFLPPGLDVT